jgi:hypothetical protein
MTQVRHSCCCCCCLPNAQLLSVGALNVSVRAFLATLYIATAHDVRGECTILFLVSILTNLLASR